MGAATLATLFFGAVAFVALGWGTGWNLLTALPLLALMAAVVVLTLVVLEPARAAGRSGGAPAARHRARAADRRARAQPRRLADRNRLARDLHDTIGHALTASLLQATAARRT